MVRLHALGLPLSLAALTWIASPPLAAQPNPPLDTAYADVLLDHLNVRDADLRDVFRSVAQAYDLNLVVDNRIRARVTLRLADVPVLEALAFLCREHDLRLSRKGRILRVDLPLEPEPLPPPPLDVAYRDGLLSLDLHDADLERALRAIHDATGANLVLRRGVRGVVSGTLRDVPLDVGLRTLLAANGFAFHRRDGIIHVDRLAPVNDGDDAADATGLWVQIDDSGVALDLRDAPIPRVVRALGARADSINLAVYALPEDRITLRAAGLSLEDALALVLRGTGTAVRRDGPPGAGTYTIGHPDSHGVADTRLIRFDHLRADSALALLPEALAAETTLQVVKEHNGLLVSGPPDRIRAVERVAREIDHPTPQILIEALVVDFESTDLRQLGLEFGRDPDRAEAGRRGRYAFDADGASFDAEGRRLNKAVEHHPLLGDLFGLHKIGRLPDDFYLRLQALDEEGRIDIRSRPQIATLNGHTATISIGTTQYYLLNTNTYLPYTPSQGPIGNLQSAQRFEKIEANVRLEITPWVSRSGEVTAEIRPEFSTPVGEFDPEVAPTINTRVLESTVRLQDGETIILGGMIREVEQTVRRKLPVLGSIPLLGRLFRSTSRSSRKSELVIFLTPHVFFGDADDARWRALHDRLDLDSASEGVIEIGHTRTRKRR